MGFFENLFEKETNADANVNTNASASKVSSAVNEVPMNRSIDDIFGKGFRFVVDRYEEWANQQCISQGRISAEIVAEVREGKIVFKLSGEDVVKTLDIVSTPSMDLSNEQSQVLKAGDLLTKDRIQYFANTITAWNDPYICHLFCDNGRISYVRFGFLDPNSQVGYPVASRIYEFYGDMVELVENPKEEVSAQVSFTPFVFKSTCHQRYENIVPVMGLQHCVRTITVEKNINGCSGYDIKPGDGYIVKVFNNDEGKPNMSDKPMRIKSVSKDLVVFQGYPLRAMSLFGWMEVNYEDYGFEVHYRNGEVEKCILHMYDRDTYIEYRR